MIAEKSSGKKLFPAVYLRFETLTRSSRITLTPVAQIVALLTVVGVTGTLAYLGISQVGYVRIVDEVELAKARVETANVYLQDDIAGLRDRLAVADRDRAAAEERLSTLASQTDALRGQLDVTETRLRALEQKLSERERPPDQAAEAGTVDPLRSEPSPPEAIPAVPEVTRADTPAKAKRQAEGVAELGLLAVTEFKRALASVGVDVVGLFSHFGMNRAEGGPFVPPPRADQSAGTADTNRLAVLRGLAKSLPLSIPVAHYQIGSRFGARRDPFNGRTAFHSGLDFDGPYMSPVYATAPGIVTYVGYKGAYGKVVEIDHGSGVVTLYGHMHRYLVSVGQKVEAQTEIGLLGSTGRSSGPHLHYEVIVNGQPQDPEKFIGLARLVPIADSSWTVSGPGR
jgi:murein DD-endopeptidase MepM/ murein hydrolase activator NlpD